MTFRIIDSTSSKGFCMTDKIEEIVSDDIFSLASAFANRVRWEKETGAVGFQPPHTKSPLQPVPNVQPAPIAQISSVIKPADGENNATALAALRTEIGDCSRCQLHSGRTKLVFGDGNFNAKLVFVGEGPGRDEDLSGVPFVGAAGQLLDKIIVAIGLTRKDVYICNVVKCRPPNNRDPQPIESSTCGPFMRRQLEIIRPEVIVALGRPASHFLLNTNAPMGKLRGHFHDLDGMKVMPTYHPAYLLRNASAKRPVWEDMKQVRDLLNLSGNSK